LGTYLAELFKVADSNGDGVLQPSEFRRLLRLSGFNFSEELIDEVLNIADTNHDGVIEYDEFIPAMVGIIKAIAAKEAMPNLADVPPRMLEDYLTKLFQVADTNGDGVLQPEEFQNLLEMSGFNLPTEIVVELLEAADVNHDGVIEYGEFIPVALEMLKAKTGMVGQPRREILAKQDSLEDMTKPQLMQLARDCGLKKAGRPWAVCCPPFGQDMQGERRGPDSCAKQDVVQALRKKFAHIDGYWTNAPMGSRRGQYQVHARPGARRWS